MSEYIKKEELFDKTIRKNSAWNATTNANGENLEEIVNSLPTYSIPEEREPTHDEVMKYCRERCLLLITYEAFRKLNARSPFDVKPIV